MISVKFKAWSLNAAIIRIASSPYSTRRVVITSETRALRISDDVEIIIDGLDDGQALRLVTAINAAMGDRDALAELNDMMRPEYAETETFSEALARHTAEGFTAFSDLIPATKEPAP